MANIIQMVLDFIHIVAVMIWMGGGIYFFIIVQPSLAGLPPDQAGRLAGGMVKKFTPIAWGSIITIGVIGLLYRGNNDNPDFGDDTHTPAPGNTRNSGPHRNPRQDKHGSRNDHDSPRGLLGKPYTTQFYFIQQDSGALNN
jgi:hypothetical protein